MPDKGVSGLQRYLLEARGSRFTIHAYAGGVLSVVGHDPVIVVRDLVGEVRFSPEASTPPIVRIRIRAASLVVQNDAADRDRREMERLMHDEVLETATYPEILYEADQGTVKTAPDGRHRVDFAGELSLHGVTRPQRLTALVAVSTDNARATGELAFRQTDFGIKLVTFAAGTLKIRDEVKGVFDLLARKLSAG